MKKLFVVLSMVSVLFACNSGGDKEAAQPEKAADTPGVSGGADATAMGDTKGLELIGANDCMTCHDLNAKKIGPAYSDVAKKYENTPANVDTLVNKIIHGGSGNWGTVPMTAHPDLPREDAKTMVTYIMSLKNQ